MLRYRIVMIISTISIVLEMSAVIILIRILRNAEADIWAWLMAIPWFLLCPAAIIFGLHIIAETQRKINKENEEKEKNHEQ